MHEYAITQNIIAIVAQEAKKVQTNKVLEINIVLGELSTIIDSSVQMYFDIISKGTLAEGAKLKFRKIPIELRCSMCNNTFYKPKIGFNCNLCGNYGVPTGKGKEFYIESIEVE